MHCTMLFILKTTFIDTHFASETNQFSVRKQRCLVMSSNSRFIQNYNQLFENSDQTSWRWKILDIHSIVFVLKKVTQLFTRLSPKYHWYFHPTFHPTFHPIVTRLSPNFSPDCHPTFHPNCHPNLTMCFVYPFHPSFTQIPSSFVYPFHPIVTRIPSSFVYPFHPSFTQMSSSFVYPIVTHFEISEKKQSG